MKRTKDLLTKAERSAIQSLNGAAIYTEKHVILNLEAVINSLRYVGHDYGVASLDCTKPVADALRACVVRLQDIADAFNNAASLASSNFLAMRKPSKRAKGAKKSK